METLNTLLDLDLSIFIFYSYFVLIYLSKLLLFSFYMLLYAITEYVYFIQTEYCIGSLGYV